MCGLFSQFNSSSQSVQHGYRKPANPRKNHVKAGTGHGWFESLRLSGLQDRHPKLFQPHGFSREFFRRPEDPKMSLLLVSFNFQQKIFLILYPFLETPQLVLQYYGSFGGYEHALARRSSLLERDSIFLSAPFFFEQSSRCLMNVSKLISHKHTKMKVVF